MSRSRHLRPAKSRAAAETMQRFQAILPVLLANVAVHGVAHVKLLRADGAGGTTVLVLDDTANRLPGRGHRIDERRIDYPLLREAHGG